MITFEVKDMTCGHCASTITKALKNLDRDARINVDLGQRIVQIQTGDTDAQKLGDAIKEAGYSPVRVIESAENTKSVQIATGCKCH